MATSVNQTTNSWSRRVGDSESLYPSLSASPASTSPAPTFICTPIRTSVDIINSACNLVLSKKKTVSNTLESTDNGRWFNNIFIIDRSYTDNSTNISIGNSYSLFGSSKNSDDSSNRVITGIVGFIIFSVGSFLLGATIGGLVQLQRKLKVFTRLENEWSTAYNNTNEKNTLEDVKDLLKIRRIHALINVLFATGAVIAGVFILGGALLASSPLTITGVALLALSIGGAGLHFAYRYFSGIESDMEKKISEWNQPKAQPTTFLLTPIP